jgi:hypothetical protein
LAERQLRAAEERLSHVNLGQRARGILQHDKTTNRATAAC